MPTLSIQDFSCLKEASFSPAPVNIIIGPQGSGKSVTTKLFYFLSDLPTSFLHLCERGDGLEVFKQHISKQFSLWFPPGAWGRERFIINYNAGPFSVRVMRRRIGGVPGDQVSIKFSEWFSETYNEALHSFRSAPEKAEPALDSVVEVSEAIDRIWQVRNILLAKVSKDLGAEYIARQTFIPAGRAFFTSIGRLVAGIEQAGSLDPVTIKFARLFANLRDRRQVRHRLASSEAGEEFLLKRRHFMSSLFGGEIKFDGEREYVETIDGRQIPFSALSSGQQELLPMWTLVDYFGELDALRAHSGRTRLRELFYIEEPEAHLFPSAQSLLMEFLIGSISSNRTGRSIILTTHSPYIMGKLNVFLKAGQLSRRKKRNNAVNEVVPRDCWLSQEQVAALAIKDGHLVNILDEDGLIDGRYLDEVSEETSREFSQLLKIESEFN